MRTLFFLLLLAASAAAFAFWWAFSGALTALDSEGPIARIAISQVDGRPQRFVLDTEYASGARASYRVAGDYFLMQGEVRTLKGSAALIAGGEAGARLTRIEGMYNEEYEVPPPLCFKDDVGALSDENWDGSDACISQHKLEGDQYRVLFTGMSGPVTKAGEWLLETTKSEKTRPLFMSAAGVQMFDGDVVWVCLTEDALVIRLPDDGCAGAETALADQ